MHKYQEWYFKIVIRNWNEIWDNFEISRVVFMPNITYGSWYYLLILLPAKGFTGIFTFRYFKLSWNTTALSQSDCRNFSSSSITALICNFTCEITKLPWQPSVRLIKCYEWRCQGIKRRFRKPEHTKEHIKKDSNRYFVKKFWKF